MLIELGSNVRYYDPYVPVLQLNNKPLQSLDNLSIKNLKENDISVVITDHSNLDYKMVEKYSTAIIDTRNIYKNYNSNHIKRLGEGKNPRIPI